MLGYRSIFAVPGEGIVDAVRSQLHGWLRSKGYRADRLEENGPVAAIGDRVESVLTSEWLQDGSRSALFMLREDRDPNGAWISQVIVHEPASPKSPSWVWIDVEQEGSSRPTAAVPNLARRLLDVLPATDGGARLGAAPAIVTEDDVPDLVAALSSQQRRGPVFVAGSSEILPLTRWTEYVGKLLHDTVGLAAGYVLNPGATEALRESLGPRHAVIAGTLRTYLPGIEPASSSMLCATASSPPTRSSVPPIAGSGTLSAHVRERSRCPKVRRGGRPGPRRGCSRRPIRGFWSGVRQCWSMPIPLPTEVLPWRARP